MSTNKHTYLNIENKGALRKIVLSNPAKKNSLNTLAYQELTGNHLKNIYSTHHLWSDFIVGLRLDALYQAGIDNTVAVVAITGEGPFYSSGNDLSAFLETEDPIEALRQAKPILRQIIRAFYTFPKLLICVVNGPCIGIAATTAILCDVIYASETVNKHQIKR